jgi:MFS-type transporter involved in bile tolerance (Atg22 family)
MKLKTIQSLALAALGTLIVIGTLTRVFDSAETIMWSAVWLGCAAAHVTTSNSDI